MSFSLPLLLVPLHLADPALRLEWLIAAMAVSLVCLAAIVLEQGKGKAGLRRKLAARNGAQQSETIRSLIVGVGDVGEMLAHSLTADGRHRVIGFVDDVPARQVAGRWPVVGTRDRLSALVDQLCIDEVYVACAPSWQQQLAEELAQRHPATNLWVVPTSLEALMQLDRVRSVGDVAVVGLAGEKLRRGERAKRWMDVLVAAAALLLLSPLMLLIAFLIRVASPGPVIFTQERVGRHGRTFKLYKFRTMIPNAEERTGPVLASGLDDPRLTRFGRILRKLRLDELPQLWNVLRGEMSLVGPRPERPCFVRRFAEEIPSYTRRHLVRPGITGLAQVCAGYHTEAREKLRFDLIYISHQSVWLDLSIMFRTVAVMFADGKE